MILNSVTLEEVMIYIYDMNGRILWNEKYRFKSESNEIDLNVGPLASGLYTVLVVNENDYKREMFYQK